MSTHANGSPKYRHFKPKNLGVVRLDGKDHYCPGPYQSDESLAHYYQLLADWRAGRLRTKSSPPSAQREDQSQTLWMVELILRYWEFVKGYFVKDGKPTSEQGCIHGALKPLRRLYGNTPAKDFGPLALKAVREEMIDAGLCRNTINKHIGRIRRLFAWAVENELLPVEVYQALCTVKDLTKGRSRARETQRVAPVAEDQMRAVLPELSKVLRAMVLFQWHTGCRPSEACRLRPQDLDREGNVWCYRPESHKTEHHDQERRIYIGPKAQEILLPFLNRPAEAYCFDPRESVSCERSRVSSTKTHRDRAKCPRLKRRGTRYTKDSYCRAIVRACERAGIDRWTPNQLRHSRATAIRAKFGLEASQCVLGHTKADVTQIYAERDFSKAKEIMGKIG